MERMAVGVPSEDSAWLLPAVLERGVPGSEVIKYDSDGDIRVELQVEDGNAFIQWYASKMMPPSQSLP